MAQSTSSGLASAAVSEETVTFGSLVGRMTLSTGLTLNQVAAMSPAAVMRRCVVRAMDAPSDRAAEGTRWPCGISAEAQVRAHSGVFGSLCPVALTP